MADALAPTRRASWWRRLPVVHQLGQSVGLQRGMLVAGLVISAVFVLTALLAPVLAPFGYGQLRGPDGPIGAQRPVRTAERAVAERRKDRREQCREHEDRADHQARDEHAALQADALDQLMDHRQPAPPGGPAGGGEGV